MRRVLATLTVASIFALGCSQAPTAPAARVNPTVSLSCGSTTNNDNNPPTTAGGGSCNNNNNNNGNTGNNSNNPPTTAGN